MRTGGILFKLAQFLITAYLVFVELTSRSTVKSSLPLERLKAMDPVALYSFWHNRIFHFCWLFRKAGGAIPISTHRDGMLIAGVAKTFGHKVISGSSNRSATAVLTGIIGCIQKGISVGITPDGPRGPRYAIQDGILFAAWKTGAPIIPTSWYAAHVKTFKSWDGFILPLPFNRIHAVIGEPLYVRSREEIPLMKKILETEMVRVTLETEEYFAKK